MTIHPSGPTMPPQPDPVRYRVHIGPLSCKFQPAGIAVQYEHNLMRRAETFCGLRLYVYRGLGGNMNHTLKKILCPIDFTERSMHALRAAYALALCFSAHLVTVCVTPGPQSLRLPASRQATHEILNAFYSEQLSLAVSQWTSGNVEVQSMVLRGDPADEIVRAAEDLAVDAIVMADDPKDSWERARDGSTLEEVTTQSRCPVYVLKISGEEGEPGAKGSIKLS
jgi:nucleotide-binding universal stress UspA family protein